MLPIISADEVRTHSTPEDLWMVVHNKVYNLTSFAALHPGGAEVLLDCAGADASEAFEDVGHSQDAFDMLAPYLVGELPSNECKLVGRLLSSPEEKVIKTKKKKKKTKPMMDQLKRQVLVVALVTLAVLALLVVVALQKLQWLKLTSF